MSPEEMNDQKELAWFSAALGSWLECRSEHDKSLLALSSGGVGLLITAFDEVVTTHWLALTFFGALFCFLLCILLVLVIFTKNSDYLFDHIQHGKSSVKIAGFDRVAKASFFVGIALSAILGFSLATSELPPNKGEANMAKERDPLEPPELTIQPSKDWLYHEPNHDQASIDLFDKLRPPGERPKPIEPPPSQPVKPTEEK